MRSIYFWVLAAVVAVAAVAYFYGGKGPSIVLEEETPPVGGSASPLSAPAAQAPKPGSAVISVQAYSELVRQYEGRRIQFDEGCQVFPNDISFKNGTKVMLDNRAPAATNVNLGGTVFSLPAYGYQLVTLSSPTLPKTLNVACGSSPSVGKILLQAIILPQ